MRVLQIGKFCPDTHGGIETVTRDLISVVGERGGICDTICMTAAGRVAEEAWGDMRLWRVPITVKVATGHLSLGMISTVRRLLPEYDVAVVHMPNPAAAVALLAAPARATRVVVFWHSDVVGREVLYRLYRPLERALLARAARIVVTSNAYAEASTPIQPFLGKVRVIPPGIRDPGTADGSDSHRWRVPPGGRVLAVGRLIRYKGFHLLVEAMKGLPDGSEALIVGEGPERGALQAAIARHGLEARVTLTGPVSNSDLDALYRSADLLCVPSTSRAEAFGLVQVEAMSRGLPVVSAAISGSGSTWVNRHGVTGLHFSVGDVEGLAHALRRMLTDAEFREAAGTAARARFEERFTYRAMGRAVFAMLQDVAEP